MQFRINVSKLLKILFGSTVVVVIVLFFALSSIIDLLLNIQFYQNRLDKDWWYVFTMDNSAILWCPLITILILVVLVTILNPVTSSTLTLIYSIARPQSHPSRRQCILWNYLVIGLAGGIGMGWVLGFMSEAGFGIFAAMHTNLPIEFSAFFSALSYPLNPGMMDVNTLFIFTYILRPFIGLIIGAFIAKIVIDLINTYVFHRGASPNTLKTTGSIILIVSLIFFIIWLNLPSASFDVIDSTTALGVVVGFFTSLSIGSFFYALGFILREEEAENRHIKQILALCLIILVLLPTITFIIAGAKNLYREVNWKPWIWDTKISNEISNTRTAAGLTNFNALTTQQLLNNRTVSNVTDTEIIAHIRTYDLDASRLSMKNQIGTRWETLADSDITYINGTEFWLAPRTINFTLDWVQEHIIYTHSRGFIALNPTTGALIPYSAFPDIFGVDYNYSIYFGELPDNYYTILNNTQFKEIMNVTYQGAPDVKLSGFLNWWFIEDWGFKTFDETGFLIKRNINDRVGGILLPHMIIGDDPYLVFDVKNKRMYYSLDIILDFPSFSGYMQSDIVRWLGVVLVDTATGEMKFYRYNKLDLPPYDFLQVYMNTYTWNEMPDWLIPQLKYPEMLIEYQTEMDYTYHIQDAMTWRDSNDLFVRPTNADLHYIIYDLGYGLTYVGASIVEFKSASVGNLVGFYIVENGRFSYHLGDVLFYRNGTHGETQMIGLETAVSAYQQKDAQYLKLLITKRFGNFLIYPLAGSLYYVIPTYDRTGTNTETLKRVALVNVFDPSVIGIGNSTLQAYLSLNISAALPSGVLSLTVLKSPLTVQANTYQPQINDLELLLDNGYSTRGFNVYVNISTESNLFNVSFGGSERKPDFNGQNYTYFVANLTLLPTQYSSIIPQVTGRLPAGFISGTIKYTIGFYFANDTLIDSKDRTIIISI